MHVGATKIQTKNDAQFHLFAPRSSTIPAHQDYDRNECHSIREDNFKSIVLPRLKLYSAWHQCKPQGHGIYVFPVRFSSQYVLLYVFIMTKKKNSVYFLSLNNFLFALVFTIFFIFVPHLCHKVCSSSSIIFLVFDFRVCNVLIPLPACLSYVSIFKYLC